MGRRLYLPRSHSLVLGFGLHRNHTENQDPWLRGVKDVNNAFPVNETRPYKEISASGFVAVRGLLKSQNYIETSPGKEGVEYPGAPSNERFIRVTPKGEEYLIEGVIYGVRNRGQTVSAILEIPESIEAFLEHAGFEERLLEAVTGLGYTAIISE